MISYGGINGPETGFRFVFIYWNRAVLDVYFSCGHWSFFSTDHIAITCFIQILLLLLLVFRLILIIT